MRSILTAILSAAAAIAVSSPVLAAETRVVPANRASGIFFYYTASPSTCYPGAKPTVHFTTGPSHGSVVTQWKSFRMSKEAGHCANKPVHGTLVIYKPVPGYHGTDTVSMIFSEQPGNDYFVRGKEWTVNITVK